MPATKVKSPAVALPPGIQTRLVYLNPKVVIEDKTNVRMKSPSDKADTAELVASIKANRQLQPILVWKDGKNFPMVFGHRRREACQVLGEEVMSLLLDREPTEAEKQRIRAIENFHRKDLNPAERAIQILQCFEANESNVDATARDLGIDPTDVREALYLQRLSKRVIQSIAYGEVNLAQARELVKIGDHDIQEKLLVLILGAANNRIVPAMEIRGWVENEKRSLKAVPWKLEVKFGPLNLACAGCPHNTATDATLFETDSQEAETGCCTNPGCFEGKSKKFAAAAEKATTKAKEEMKDRPKSMKRKLEVEEKLSMVEDVVEQFAPDFAKPEALTKVVKVELGISAKKPSPTKSAAADGPKGPDVKSNISEKEKRQSALLKWGKAYRSWAAEVGEQIRKKVEGDQKLKVVHVLLSHCAQMEQAPEFPIPVGDHELQTSTFKNAIAPKEEKPVSPILAQLLEHAGRWQWDTLANDLQLFTQWDMGHLPDRGPEFIRRIAGVFDVTPTDPPDFNDFLPAELQAPKVTRTTEDAINLVNTETSIARVTLHRVKKEYHAGLTLGFVSKGFVEKWSGPVNNGACFGSRELAIAAAAETAVHWFGNKLIQIKPSHRDELLQAVEIVRVQAKAAGATLK